MRIFSPGGFKYVMPDAPLCVFQTILGEFNKEQEKFMSEKKEKEGRQEANVPPWVGYNEEKAMKEQILALSTVSAPPKYFNHIAGPCCQTSLF